jgi:LmbE family N-acetylglucosaminyl deacetylase
MRPFSLPAWRPRFRIPKPAADVSLEDAANDRILAAAEFVIFAPHPDDEVLGFGGLIYSALKKGRRVRLVSVTNGEAWQPNCALWSSGTAEIRNGQLAGSCGRDELVEFGRARAGECTKAMALLGLDAQHIAFLGYPDLTLTRMFNEPSVVAQGRTTVQTSNTGRAFTGENLLADIVDVLRQHPGATVLTTHEDDSHPDHATVARFVQRARRRMRDEWGIEYPTYWAVIHEPRAKGARSDYWWPPPVCRWEPVAGRIRAWRERRFKTGEMLPAPSGMNGHPVVFRMEDVLWNPAVRQPPLLRDAIEMYDTQTGLRGRNGKPTSPDVAGLADWNGYLLSFVKKNHLFWPAPEA